MAPIADETRDHEKRLASDLRPAMVAGGFGLIALVLGFFGYEKVEHLSFSDSVFKSLQLFALEGEVPEAGTPLMLNIARFLAPAVVVYAAVVTAMVLVRDRAERIRVKHFARGHLVVFGLGATGSVVAGARVAGPARARAARARGRRRYVVAVEAHAGSSRIANARRRGVRVIIGDATLSSSAVAARVARAEHVVFLTGDDSRNLLALAAAQSVVPKTGRKPTFHVAVGAPGPVEGARAAAAHHRRHGLHNRVLQPRRSSRHRSRRRGFAFERLVLAG